MSWGLLISVAVIFAFWISVRTVSAELRFLIWFTIWFCTAFWMAVCSSYSIDGFAILVFVCLCLFGIVSAGVGSIAGYFFRRNPPKLLQRRFRFFGPSLPESRYNGLRCVSCNQPIDAEIVLCPKCGYTQPVYHNWAQQLQQFDLPLNHTGEGNEKNDDWSNKPNRAISPHVHI